VKPKANIGNFGSSDAAQLLEYLIAYYSPVYPEYYRFGQDCARIYHEFCEFVNDVAISNLPKGRKHHVVLLQLKELNGVIDRTDLAPMVKDLLKTIISTRSKGLKTAQ
jgi:hypothetical protein